GPGYAERHRKALAQMVTRLEAHRAAEKDPAAAIDLEILIRWSKVHIRTSELEEKYLVPYFALERMLFGGLRGVRDDQIDATRGQKMVTRLRAYAGLEPGTTPLAKEAEARTREKLGKPGLLMPVKAQLEKNLSTAESMMRGIEELFKKY